MKAPMAGGISYGIAFVCIVSVPCGGILTIFSLLGLLAIQPWFWIGISLFAGGLAGLVVVSYLKNRPAR